MKPSILILVVSGAVSALAAVALAPGCAANRWLSVRGRRQRRRRLWHRAQGGVILEGGHGGAGGSVINPCGSKCGPVELCDPAHAGLDDNCNGIVDEGCPCSMGMVQSCFKGDPSYRNMPGCFPGTQHCSELGMWTTAWAECTPRIIATTPPRPAAIPSKARRSSP